MLFFKDAHNLKDCMIYNPTNNMINMQIADVNYNKNRACQQTRNYLCAIPCYENRFVYPSFFE